MKSVVKRSRINILGIGLIVIANSAAWGAEVQNRSTRIRMGSKQTITSITKIVRKDAGSVAGVSISYPHPRPRFVGFSPLVAITTSDKRGSLIELDFEHDIENGYIGNPLNGSADENFVVGILDSGSVVDLAAGQGATTLGLTGQFLTENIIPIGGVGGTIDALITQPVAFFAAGLSHIDQRGRLDLNAVVGHSNVAAVAAPPIGCGEEVITAVIGTPFMSFYNSVIRVDTPRKVLINGIMYMSPDVSLQSGFADIDITHSIAMEIGGLTIVTTASFFPDFEFLETPIIPTLLSLTPVSIPTGGVFFINVLAQQGEPDFNNFPTSMRMMLDTGAQGSIISPAMAANLSLPLEPHFTVDVCGIGGLETDIPGYYIDYIKINALGGALEFSRVPVVVLDLQSPEGDSLDGVLGMNLFWNRNVAFEPSLTGSAFFSVSDPIPVAFGDTDVDFDVDHLDAAYFLGCMTAPNSSMASPECLHLDIDEDDDVDIYDFAAFQRCFSGFDVSANHTCSP